MNESQFGVTREIAVEAYGNGFINSKPAACIHRIWQVANGADPGTLDLTCFHPDDLDVALGRLKGMVIRACEMAGSKSLTQPTLTTIWWCLRRD